MPIWGGGGQGPLRGDGFGAQRTYPIVGILTKRQPAPIRGGEEGGEVAARDELALGESEGTQASCEEERRPKRDTGTHQKRKRGDKTTRRDDLASYGRAASWKTGATTGRVNEEGRQAMTGGDCRLDRGDLQSTVSNPRTQAKRKG